MMNEAYQKIINEVHTMVVNEWSDEDKDTFFLTAWDGTSLSQFHHSFGRWIRNKYNLWYIPWEPEIRDGTDYSPYHPDQASMTIIEEVWKLGPKL